MKPLYFSPLFVLLLLFSSVNANAKGSGLKVHCEGEDAGAEISVNGVFKGECSLAPLVIEVAPGRLKLRVEKGDREFEKDVRVGDGVLQPVDVVLAKHMSAAEQAVINNLGMVPIPGRNYEMGKFEVTQLLWITVMGSNPSNLHCEPRTITNCAANNNPVEQVSWNDIQEFLQKLNAMTGKQYRLPTEEEWEYACYGGSETEYCGGGNLDAVGWYEGNSGKQTHPSGQKQANSYGLYDMSGNVWEWMSDCWEGDCAERVIRGGSWYNDPQVARASNRNRNGVANRNVGIGFRLARTLP
jgi:hypothetical protein